MTRTIEELNEMGQPPITDHREWKNYPLMYGDADYEGKVVLDIGADWGTSPYYFLTRGAKYVIAVEGNYNNIQKMTSRCKGAELILPVWMCVENPNQINLLLRAFEPDILKIDCEGCEESLKDCSVELISKLESILIEVHWSLELAEEIYTIFRECGFECGYKEERAVIKRGTGSMVSLSSWHKKKDPLKK